MTGNLIIPLDVELEELHTALSKLDLPPHRRWLMAKELTLHLLRIQFDRTLPGIMDYIVEQIPTYSQSRSFLPAMLRMHDLLRVETADIGNTSTLLSVEIPFDSTMLLLTITQTLREDEVYGLDTYIDSLRRAGEPIDSSIDRVIRDWTSVRSVLGRRPRVTLQRRDIEINN